MAFWEIKFWKINETVTNDVVSFGQPGHGVGLSQNSRKWQNQKYSLNVTYCYVRVSVISPE